jgi:hypothetical protein
MENEKLCSQLSKRNWGRAVAQAASPWIPNAAAASRVRVDHVGFVVDKAALG